MSIFKHLILNGRPGGGKSEVIDFMKKTPLVQRRERYHVGSFVELDDFVWLWDKFVEDDIWESLGEARLYSRRVPHGYVQNEGDRLLEMFYGKFNYVIGRDYAGDDGFYDDHTLIVEFARGVQDGGYRRAYDMLSTDILADSAILYIQVSYEESRRRNDARYQEALAHSILAHKLPEESLVRFSSQQDWLDITDGAPHGYLEAQGVRVPFVTMNNEPELKAYDALAERYTAALGKLHELYAAR